MFPCIDDRATVCLIRGVNDDPIIDFVGYLDRAAVPSKLTDITFGLVDRSFDLAWACELARSLSLHLSDPLEFMPDAAFPYRLKRGTERYACWRYSPDLYAGLDRYTPRIARMASGGFQLFAAVTLAQTALYIGTDYGH